MEKVGDGLDLEVGYDMPMDTDWAQSAAFWKDDCLAELSKGLPGGWLLARHRAQQAARLIRRQFDRSTRRQTQRHPNGTALFDGLSNGGTVNVGLLNGIDLSFSLGRLEVARSTHLIAPSSAVRRARSKLTARLWEIDGQKI